MTPKFFSAYKGMELIEGFALIPENDFAVYLTMHEKYMVSNFLVS